MSDNPVVVFNGKRHFQPAQLPQFKTFVEVLARHIPPQNILFNSQYAASLEKSGFLCPGLNNRVETLPESCSLVISVGGDGTFIKTARWVGNKELPVLGINGGHLGYLSATDLKDAVSYLPDILSGDLVFEARSMLHVRALDNTHIPYPFALNEVAVLKDDTASMINIDTEINGRKLARYPADGLLISTPTGSTAYNLSVGGPVIAPETPAFVVAPVAPHALTLRPIVVPDSCVLGVRVQSRVQKYRLALDGHSLSLPLSAELVIEKASFRTIIARLGGGDFVHSLRTKLLWGVDPR